jgi:hypothetical protein
MAMANMIMIVIDNPVIINDASRVIIYTLSALNNLECHSKCIIYNRNTFIIKATEAKFLVVCDSSMNEL